MTVKHKRWDTILGIDRGSKYIWVAYTNSESSNEVIFPLGYILNDQMVYFALSDIIYKYRIKEIVIGRPSKQEDIQEKITKFMTSLNSIIEDQHITIHTQEEDYSSVQSGEILSSTAQSLWLTNNDNNYRKNAAQDTISSMVILERWINQKPQ